MSAHTWEDLAVGAGVAPEHAEFMLWSASAFPFADPRTVFFQLQHAHRHKVCVDDPWAPCTPRRAFRRPLRRQHNGDKR
jgi:hypothetical protein